MTRQKVILLLLAALLVYVGVIAIRTIPYQRIYQGIMHPKADAEDVSQQLKSDNALTRRQGLDAYHSGLRDDDRVIDNLVLTALNDADEENRLHALKLLNAKISFHLTQFRKQAPLKLSDIDQLVERMSEDSTAPGLQWMLVLFAGNTAQWQSQPQAAINRLSALLTETFPVAGEEKYAAYTREENQRTVLQALKAYARYTTLPDQTLESLLPLYKSGPAYRLRPEIGYIYQYHAIHGPLPAAVRQAVVDTMQNSDDRNFRLTAIMTMEWIGKEEGKIPPEMIDALNNNEDDLWLRNNMNHVIIRMQMYFSDPLASLLAVVNNAALPDSIRANALREAGKNFPQEVRFKEAVKNLHNAEEAPLRAAAISLLSYSAEQANDTRVMIDISLADADPGVRILALRKLAALPLSDNEKISRFERALDDDDEEVISWAARTISNTHLTSEAIEQRLAELKKTGKLQGLEEKQAPGLWQTIVAAAKDTRHHGMRLYGILSVLGILIAAIFAIYFVYGLLITLQQRSRRGFAIFGILIAWTGLTYAMVVLFVLGAFSFGHNSLVSPGDQLIIISVAGSALLLYGFIGWALGRVVRKRIND